MSEPGIEARVGAKWWADKIRAQLVDPQLPDNGSEPGDPTRHPLAVGLAALVQQRELQAITPEKIDAYESALASEIQAMLDEGDTGYFTALKLGCDYGPGPAHTNALEAAGIRPGMTILPWKTTMWVQHGSVQIGDGYGAAPVELALE